MKAETKPTGYDLVLTLTEEEVDSLHGDLQELYTLRPNNGGFYSWPSELVGRLNSHLTKFLNERIKDK